MYRVFIETDVFRKLIDEERDTELEKRVKDTILSDPLKGDLIKGTGGLRKIRLAKSNEGKSGGYRVIYLDLKKYDVTYLLILYSKNVQENLTREQKRILKSKVEELKNEYKKKSNR